MTLSVEEPDADRDATLEAAVAVGVVYEFGSAKASQSVTSRPPMTPAAIIGLSITLLGVLLLLFVGYVLGWSNIQATHNQQRLAAEFARSAELASNSGRIPADGEPAAVLDIPLLDIHDLAVEGTSAADLQQGPGIMPTAPFPGTMGESVVVGRDLTFGGVFRSIHTLRPGATISITDYLGTFKYTVYKMSIVAAGGYLPVFHSNVSSIALVTSHQAVPPSGFTVVYGRLDGMPSRVAVLPGRATIASELSLGGDSSAVLPFLGWAFVLVLALLASAIAYRRVRHALLVYVLTMPILLVLALVTFENAARLLPATM